MALTTLENQDNQTHYLHSIILVHGLNGSNKTWGQYDEPLDDLGDKFITCFENEPLIFNNFKIYLFEYDTKTLNYFDWWKKLKSLLPGSKKSQSFNVGLRSISEELNNSVRAIEKNYDTISFIGHSMGGVIIKKALIFLSDLNSKIPFFLSLNVPHQGAQLADIGHKVLFGGNIQLDNLKLLGEYTTALGNDYANAGNPSRIIYAHGNKDLVVVEAAAIPPSVPQDLRIITNDNHYTICRVKANRVNQVYLRLLEELRFIIEGQITITITIPENQNFSQVAMTLASRANRGIKYEGFENHQITGVVKSGSVDGRDIMDLIEKLENLTVPRPPAYNVIQESQNFLIQIQT